MLNKYHKVFVSGIGGIGVSAIARFFLHEGVVVVGSDAMKTVLTEKLVSEGVTVYYEQKADNITPDLDLLVYSPAVPEDNPERVAAVALGIEQKSYPEVLGELSLLYDTIAVSGTNGKSTTTAMLSNIMIEAEVDPTVILGSQFPRIGGNFRYGQSDKFIVEACEYRSHMLNLSPRTIVLTNIEEDHLDYFTDINHIVRVFQEYVSRLNEPGDLNMDSNLLVINNDDFHAQTLSLPVCRLVTYGIDNKSMVMAKNICIDHERQLFDVYRDGVELGRIELHVPGRFNVYNALAAIATALAYDISFLNIQNAFEKYFGIWRRFEKIYDKEIVVISDYAHHPTAVAATIAAARDFFPDRRIVTVFQPHQHNRTKNLFEQFVEALSVADVIVLPEIFEVTGREELTDRDVSSHDLVAAILARSPEKEVHYAKDLTKTMETVKKIVRVDDLVLVMGAGDVYTIADKIGLA